MLKVKSFNNNPFQENTYLLIEPDSKQCLIIDPGMSNQAEWMEVQQYMKENELTPNMVLLTHGHVDHLMGTGYIADTYGVKPFGPIEDIEKLPSAQMQGRLFGVTWEHEPALVSKNIKEGDSLQIGECKIDVLDIPGHSFHGLCYYLPQEKMLFSGDVLFFCSIGRSDFGPMMGGDGETLVEGIRCKLLSLPPDTTVYPGHGPETTIGQEIQCNPFF